MSRGCKEYAFIVDIAHNEDVLDTTSDFVTTYGTACHIRHAINVLRAALMTSKLPFCESTRM